MFKTIGVIVVYGLAAFGGFTLWMKRKEELKWLRKNRHRDDPPPER